MKKLFGLFFAIFFINLINFGSVNSLAKNVQISRLSKVEGNSFIEIRNYGEDLIFEKLVLSKISSTSGRENSRIETGIKQLKSGEYLIIPVEKNIEEPVFRILIDDEESSYICASVNGRCSDIRLPKNAPKITAQGLINNLEGIKISSKYQYENILSTDEGFERKENQNNDETLDDNQNQPPKSDESQETPEKPSENEDNQEDIKNPPLKIIEISNQFIELRNDSNEGISISGVIISSAGRYSVDFDLPDILLAPGEIYTVKISDTNLKLNKTTGGKISLKNQKNETFEEIQFDKLAENSSWAFFEDKKGWKQTFKITPDEENVFLEFLPCEAGYERDSNISRCVKIKLPEEEKKCAEGYFLNPESGRCKKLEEPKVQAECAAGYFRNPETGRCKKVEIEDLPTPCASGYYRSSETGRCRKIATLASATLTPCKEGYYRHPETNRCRKIASETEELTPCKEGYELNPETNRCRKIVKNLATEEKVETSDEPKKSEFTGWWAVFGVVFVLISVVLWEFRKSILTFFKNGKK